MNKNDYLMENEEETLRLDLKTIGKAVEEQALWAGIKPGMRVADLGFGSGKTTYHLHQLVQPQGEVFGIDFAEDRILYATRHYKTEGITFLQGDIRNPLTEIGLFDFIYVRFVLEYYKINSFEIVKNISNNLKPGGILHLIDLDHNCLSHFGMPDRLEKTLFSLMTLLEDKANFDPYAGRKLYSFLYDLNFEDITVQIAPHHLIYGKLNDIDDFNWSKKAEIAAKHLGYHFHDYPNGYEEFYDEFKSFFESPRRFTYTPLISCRGIKPTTKLFNTRPL
jgi:ubiquinone/menaquinone biosynthesis C-methylase UbiE